MIQPTNDAIRLESPEYRAFAAIFIAELLPELEDAAPALVERYVGGEPLTGGDQPSGLGFNTGLLDPVVLECFRQLMDALGFAFLHLGLLGLLQNWWSGKKRAPRELALVDGIQDLVAQQRNILDCLAGMAKVVMKLEQSRGNQASAGAIQSEITTALATGIEQSHMLPPSADEHPPQGS